MWLKMVKLQKSPAGQYLITIPKGYVKDKGWTKGTELIIGFNERGNLELKEVNSRK
jgi:hypothetical protein